MTKASQTQCANFQAKLGQLNPDDLDKTLQAVVADPGQNSRQLEDKLHYWQESKRGFNQEYQEQARVVFDKWCWKNFNMFDPRRSKLPKALTFDETGRITINDDLSFSSPDVFYIPSLVKEITKSLDIQNSKIIHLDYLVRVGQILAAQNLISLTSMRNLAEVGMDLNIWGTRISGLDRLIKVGGDLNAGGVTTLTSMNHLAEVGAGLIIDGTSISSLDGLIKVGGSLRAKNVSTLSSMANLAEVGGNFIVEDTSLSNLDKLTKVGKNFHCFDDMPVLSKLTEIGGCLVLKDVDIKQFDKLFPVLKSVGKDASRRVSFVVYSGDDRELLTEILEKKGITYPAEIEVE